MDQQPFRLELGKIEYTEGKHLDAELVECADRAGEFLVTLQRQNDVKQKGWPDFLGIEVEAVPHMIRFLQRAHRVYSSQVAHRQLNSKE